MNSGESYVGEWAEGKRNGPGILHYSNSNPSNDKDKMYDGGWKKNMHDGFGFKVWASGKASYTGFFKVNRYHGFGTLKNENN